MNVQDSLSYEWQFTLSMSILVSESTVAGSDRIRGMETLQQEAKVQHHLKEQ